MLYIDFSQSHSQHSDQRVQKRKKPSKGVGLQSPVMEKLSKTLYKICLSFFPWYIYWLRKKNVFFFI